jgi:hypothetical protein
MQRRNIGAKAENFRENYLAPSRTCGVLAQGELVLLEPKLEWSFGRKDHAPGLKTLPIETAEALIEVISDQLEVERKIFGSLCQPRTPIALPRL